MGKLALSDACKAIERPIVAYCDIDGTLLDDDVPTSPRVVASIGDWRSAGNTFILASGRPARSIERLIDQTGADSAYIASNGAVVVADGLDGVSLPEAFDPATLDRIFSAGTRGGFARICYRGRTIVAFGSPMLIDIETARSGVTPDFIEVTSEGSVPEVVAALGGLPSKVLMVGEPTLAKDLSNEVAALPRVESFVSYPEYVEVMPAGVDKGVALSSLQAAGLSTPANSLAIGDGTGDIPMFALSALTVGIEGTFAASYADVTVPGPSHDGVAILLEALLHESP